MLVNLKDEVDNESEYYLKLVITNSSIVEDVVVEVIKNITIPDAIPEVDEDSVFFGKIEKLDMMGDLRIEFNFKLETSCQVWKS